MKEFSDCKADEERSNNGYGSAEAITGLSQPLQAEMIAASSWQPRSFPFLLRLILNRSELLGGLKML